MGARKGQKMSAEEGRKERQRERGKPQSEGIREAEKGGVQREQAGLDMNEGRRKRSAEGQEGQAGPEERENEKGADGQVWQGEGAERIGGQWGRVKERVWKMGKKEGERTRVKDRCSGLMGKERKNECEE